MIQEIELLLKTLEEDGLIKKDMPKKDVIRLVYGLMMINGRGQVNNLVTTWQRCSFVRRQLKAIIDSPDCIETLDMIHKGSIAIQMAKHFEISCSHAYTVCNTCIDLFKIEKRMSK